MKKLNVLAVKVSLLLLFLGTYLWALISLLPWGTELIVVYSFFLFIPMALYLVPFYSLVMLANSRLMIKLGYFASLTSFIYLFNAIRDYPIKLYMDGYMPMYQYRSIILSLISYIIASNLFFIFRLKELKQKE
ncbi:hypothetical protein [Streptococcus dentiloxodontae]